MNKKAKVIAVLIVAALLIVVAGRFFRLPLLGVHPHEAIPSHTAYFFSLNVKQLQKISDGRIDQDLAEMFFPNSLKKDLATFNQFFQSPMADEGESIYVSVQPTKSSGIDLLFICPSSRFFDLEGYLGKFHAGNLRQSIFRNQTVFTVKSGNETFSFAKYRNLLLAARHAYLVENAISQLESPGSSICGEAAFRQVFAVGKKGTGAHIFLNINELPAQFAPLIEPSKLERVNGLAQSGQWLHFHFPEKNTLSEWSAAFAPAPDQPLLEASHGASEREYKAAFTSLPTNLTGFVWLSVDALKPDSEKELWNKHFRPWAGREAILAVGEQLGNESSEHFFLLKTKDAAKAEAAIETFSGRTKGAESYDFQMFKVRQLPGRMVSDMLGSEQLMNECWATVLEDFVLFSNSRPGIDRWLGQYLAGQTFAQDAPFLQSLRPLPTEANCFVYLESEKAWQQISHCLTELQLEAFSQNPLRFQHVAATGVWDGKILELKAVTLSSQAAQEKAPANVLWRVPLRGNAVGQPALFTNNTTGELEVLVRDDENRVYLISRSGRVLWQRDIEGPILSDFTQINLHNDRERQFVFSTPSAIYVLDAKGENVADYPLQLQVPATNGVAVVDFFQSNDYQFFIACENGNAYGFDERGSPVEGWRPNTDIGTVRYPLLHFQAQGMDFLTLLDVNGNLKVFQKNGSYRFPEVKLESLFLQIPGFQEDKTSSRIVICDDEGKVNVVNFKGNDFGLKLRVGNNEGVKFAFADVLGDERKDYLAACGKELVVYSYEGSDFKKTLSQQFPWAQDDVFGLTWAGRSKQYIGMVSLVKKRIYLLDGKGRVPDQFPLEGTTRFSVADLLGDGRPVVVTGNGRSVCAYVF